MVAQFPPFPPPPPTRRLRQSTNQSINQSVNQSSTSQSDCVLQKLEPFLTNCCTVAQFLVGVMQEVSSSDFLPRSSAATRHLIQRHQQQVQAAFNDPRLLAIQNDGEAIMSSLRRDESLCCHSEDYRSVVGRRGGVGRRGQGRRRDEKEEAGMMKTAMMLIVWPIEARMSGASDGHSEK